MSALHERQKDCRIHSPLRNLRSEVPQKHLKVSIYWDVDRVARAECEEGSNCQSPNAKPHVANGFPAKTPLQLPQDVNLGNLLELIVQRRLEHAHVENAFAQSDRCRVRCDK